MPDNLSIGKCLVNSLWRIYFIFTMLSNQIMDIDELRRANIRILEKLAGSPTAAAEKAGMSYAQYVNLRDGAKDPRSGKKRGMRKETAWRFEDAFEMPRGWLDREHTSEQVAAESLPMPYIHPNPIVRQVVALMEKTDEAGRGMILMAASQALEKYRPIKQAPG